MDLDQLLKRVQWMEEERRKEKDAVALLENRLMALEGVINGQAKQIKELSSELTRLGAVTTRMDQHDANLLQQRVEMRQLLEGIDKETRKREDEMEKIRRVEHKAVENSVTDLRKELDVLPRLEKGLGARLEEEARLRRLIDETSLKIENLRRDEEEYTRTYRLLEDNRRQDAKRIVDLQGEVAALRKRADDQRGQSEVVNNSIRKIETRLSELMAVEAERGNVISTFMDRQALAQVERDRTWKEWQLRFEAIERQAVEAEAKLVSLDSVQRDTRKAQAILEELSAKVERRINEITEIQRLAEERFRQEWVTFKADDQKRWTNYTLTQDEQRGEINRRFERLIERTTQIEDMLQNLQDTLEQSIQESGKRLQSLLALVHEWNSTYERTLGRSGG